MTAGQRRGLGQATCDITDLTCLQTNAAADASGLAQYGAVAASGGALPVSLATAAANASAYNVAAPPGASGVVRFCPEGSTYDSIWNQCVVYQTQSTVSNTWIWIGAGVIAFLMLVKR